ncbi:hypothetical protein SKAU_G00229330 [Synaphobranchus kaupii]|uniref:Uncharacterized protein n=1 Tax=Synaphobranchus kaupii TaxID=118154 RepID=A0A9Q1F5A1_SYNKA|nr:hypothetical protein SKAU_G00229330 [Synaphobranchus kaupii]
MKAAPVRGPGTQYGGPPPPPPGSVQCAVCPYPGPGTGTLGQVSWRVDYGRRNPTFCRSAGYNVTSVAVHRSDKCGVISCPRRLSFSLSGEFRHRAGNDAGGQRSTTPCHPAFPQPSWRPFQEPGTFPRLERRSPSGAVDLRDPDLRVLGTFGLSCPAGTADLCPPPAVERSVSRETSTAPAPPLASAVRTEARNGELGFGAEVDPGIELERASGEINYGEGGGRPCL